MIPEGSNNSRLKKPPQKCDGLQVVVKEFTKVSKKLKA
jgi:hypothetical protein